MSIHHQLASVLAGTAIASALVITLPSTALALTGEEVNDIAREVTILIRGKESHGSGVIISKSDKTYYVLTAYHVVDAPDEYKIVTPDKQAYQLDSSKVKRLPNVDLAVVEFTSDKEYKLAKLANSDLIKEGGAVYVSGWPDLAAVGQESGGPIIRQFTSGEVSGFLEQPYQGYKMIYTNVTRAGMSGGPVFDAGGRVVGIHGLGDKEDPRALISEGMTQESARNLAGLIKPGFNYAIPINSFLTLAPQANLFLSLQVDNSPATPPSAIYAASNQVDERDKIDDLNSVLNTVNNTLDTIQRVRSIFPF
jgi:S1-C subfamily serine protease